MKHVRSLLLRVMRAVACFGPLLLVLLSALFRSINIGSLAPFADEAANILVGINSEIRRSIQPESIGRPLPAILFSVVPILQQTVFPQSTLVELSRTLASVAIGLTGMLLIGVAKRWGGIIAAWIVALVWSFAPLPFLHGRLSLQDPFTVLALTVACWCVVCRPTNQERSRFGEWWWIAVAAVSVQIAMLNKASEIPWLLAVYLVEQQRRGAPLIPALSTALCWGGVTISNVVMLSWSSTERLQGIGFLRLAPTIENVQWRVAYGVFHYQRLIWEYFAESSLLFLVAPLIAALLCRRLVGFALVLLLHQLMLCWFFGPIFFGRYLLPSLIPWSLLLGVVSSELLQEARSVKRRSIIALGWCVAVSFCLLGWLRGVVTVLQDPVENSFSRRVPPTEEFTDYEPYTSYLAAGVGIEEVLAVLRRVGDPVVLIGPPHLEALTLGARLLYRGESGIEVIEADTKRWDFPFLVSSLQQAGKKVLLLDVPLCQAAPPVVCSVPDPLIAGVNAKLIGTVHRAPPFWQGRLYSLDLIAAALSPPQGGGVYPDGVVAPVVECTVVNTEVQLSGKSLTEVPLGLRDIEVFVDDQLVPIRLQQDGEHFTVAVQSLLSEESYPVRLVFKRWRIEVSPYDRTSTYCNAKRAVSAKMSIPS